MKFLQRLIGPVNVLCIRFDSPDSYRLHACTVRLKKGKLRVLDSSEPAALDQAKKGMIAGPVLLSVSGYGVITKAATDTAVTDKVTSDSERFEWSHSEPDRRSGTCSFVRREQIVPLRERLELNGISTVCLNYVPQDEDPQREARRQAESFFRDRLKWRDVLRPAPSGAMLAGTLARRLRLPVLAGILILLVGNHFLEEYLQERYAQVHARLVRLQSRQGEADTLSRRRRQLAADFGRGIPYRFSLLCDRIARRIPASVTLTGLCIQPVKGRIESERPVMLAERTIVIRGETAAAAPISELLAGLRTEPFATNASLRSVEQNKESAQYEFQIEIPL